MNPHRNLVAAITLAAIEIVDIPVYPPALLVLVKEDQAGEHSLIKFKYGPLHLVRYAPVTEVLHKVTVHRERRS